MLQVSFLPWVSFDESVKIGRITFWPYYQERDTRVIDADVKNHLDRHFDRYVDHRGRPAHTITVSMFEDRGFEQLDEAEIDEMRDAVHGLAFATIAPRIRAAVCAADRTNGPPTADVFELLSHDFIPGVEALAVQAGSLTNMGLRIDEITFAKPWATGGPAWPSSRSLVKALNNSLASGVPGVRERIFRSFEWFLMAHLENSPVSRTAKIVLMATAIEILLQFGGTKWGFVEYIEKVFAASALDTCARSTRTKQQTLTMAGGWAYDFYELRNKIVHGEIVQPDELLDQSGWSHNVMADVVFLECVDRELLIRQGEGKERMKRLTELWGHKSEDEIVELLWLAQRGFSGLERALGWTKIPEGNE